MVETAIETGMRWGELIALKPRHIDFLRTDAHRRGDHRRGLQEALPHRRSATSPSPTPRTTNPAPSASDQDWLDAARRPHQAPTASAATTCSSPPRAGTPISRNTFRTRVWLPAVKASGVDFAVRMHDLRHAHASWLLAGGSDLKSVMDRMGHAQIQTTQKYLHALPDADQKNLDALARIQEQHLASHRPQ